MNTLNSESIPCLKSIFPRCYHLKQKLAIALGVAAAALLLPANASAQCVTASAGGVWTNTAMTAQTGTFTATFDATPSASPTNSVVALSDGAQTAYANFSCLVRFNTTGDIDARNGGAFAASSTIPYKAGVAYHFRLAVNVAAKTYSIYVTPAGGSELTVGLNYAFRIAATTLNWWGVSVETAANGGAGTVTVCNFSTGGTLPQAGAPSFSPAPGTYTSAQSVAITTATSGASIRYTTDGSTPSETAGTLYSGPVNISATATLQAIAYESGFTDSTITSGTYTITLPPPTGIEINCGGPAVSPFVADEDFTGGATIDHANTINTSKVTNPAPAAVYQSARVTATAGAGTTFSYTIGGFAAGSSNTVRLHFCETFHTTAGSRVFNVSINGTQVLTNFDIFATAGGENIANIQQFTEAANSSGQYVIVFTSVTDKALISGIEIDSSTTPPQAAAPSFSPGGGSYTSAQSVTIASATSGASIRYTTDGSTPSETAGTIYSAPVSIAATTTLNAIAYESGFTDSSITSATYTIGTPPPQVATPSFSPGGGTYTSAQSVTITSATSGASIRYTTDGSQPSETAGTLYSGPVSIAATTTLNAIAYESGFTDSAVASGTYTISSGQTWTLIWSDEFNGPAGSSPNPANWNYDTGGGGWGNAELEYYCAPTSGTPCNPGNPNIYLDGNGNLVIKAINSGGTWTSGRMNTNGKFQVQYGRIEARMKLPVGAGIWPAFWMLGTNIGSVGWPTCGEQDIMEWVPQYTPTTTSSHIHGPGYSGSKGIGADFTFPNGGRTDDASYHVYGVIWAANKLQFYRDDYTKPFLTLTPANIPAGTQWVYNHPFNILLNLAIGGGFPGNPDASTPNPAIVLVDWVRVYQ